jgi:hypothetical protein
MKDLYGKSPIELIEGQNMRRFRGILLLRITFSAEVSIYKLRDSMRYYKKIINIRLYFYYLCDTG